MCWKNPVPWSHLSRRLEGPRTLEGQRLAALAPCSLKVETASPYLASFLSLAESFRVGMDRPLQAAAALLCMRKWHRWAPLCSHSWGYWSPERSWLGHSGSWGDRWGPQPSQDPSSSLSPSHPSPHPWRHLVSRWRCWVGLITLPIFFSSGSSDFVDARSPAYGNGNWLTEWFKPQTWGLCSRKAWGEGIFPSGLWPPSLSGTALDLAEVL